MAALRELSCRPEIQVLDPGSHGVVLREWLAKRPDVEAVYSNRSDGTLYFLAAASRLGQRPDPSLVAEGHGRGRVYINGVCVGHYPATLSHSVFAYTGRQRQDRWRAGSRATKQASHFGANGLLKWSENFFYFYCKSFQ
ncbi:hypothetical protein MHOCP_04400 [Moorella humiferrea]